MNLITLKDVLIKKEGRSILEIPYLAVQEGDSLAIIGPNGAGKTTLLMCLARLERLTRGNIFLRGAQVGKEISDIDFRKKTAVVFQQPLLFSTSVFDNVAYGLKLRKYSRQQIAERVMKHLDYFKIGDLAGRAAKTLSGGEAQRVSLARALALEPEVLLLDEPFASLDAPTSEKIITELKDTIIKTNTTLLLVTHNKLEALQMASRVVVLGGGKMVQQGALDDVFQKPANEFVASFSGIDAILCGEVIEACDGLVGVIVSGKRIEATGSFAVGSRVVAFIRPDNVVLSLDEPQRMSAKNHFRAKVVDCLSFGHYHKVVLDCGFTLNSVVVNPTITEMNIKVGKSVFASFKATAVHLVAG